MLKIAPSILSADFTELGESIRQADAGGADYIHVDIMDGQFVPNISMGPVVVEAARRSTQLPLDVHLMVDRPERFLADFAHAGANIITIHVEACLHLLRAIEHIRELGLKPGVTLNPGTPLETVWEALPYVDQVLVMTVNPGFGGQRYIPTMTQKIARLASMIAERNPSVEIEVDGGIEEAITPAVVGAGAQILVAGTYVFRHPQGVAAGIAALRKAASGIAPAGRAAGQDAAR